MKLKKGWKGTIFHSAAGTFKCEEVLFVGEQVVVFREDNSKLKETVLLISFCTFSEEGNQS